MTWTNIRRTTLVLFVLGLLAMSLLLAACGAHASHTGSSNATPNATSSTSTAGGVDQQVQNGIQSIDNAQQDVNNADATATTDSGTDPQP